MEPEIPRDFEYGDFRFDRIQSIRFGICHDGCGRCFRTFKFSKRFAKIKCRIVLISKMRGKLKRKRNRSTVRKNRPHTQELYQASARIIQRTFRTFLKNRYVKLCKNHDDCECISLTPITEIPRSLLVVVDKTAYCAIGLSQWSMKSNRDPMTRKILPIGTKEKCVSKIESFLKAERRIYKRKGFHSRQKKHRKLLKILQNVRR